MEDQIRNRVKELVAQRDQILGQIKGGTLLTVPNSELKSLRIERPLDNLHLPQD